MTHPRYVFLLIAIGLIPSASSALAHPSPQHSTVSEPASLATLLSRAHASEVHGDRDAAERLLTQAIHLYPSSREVNLALANLMLGGHRYHEAMDSFEMVLSADPQSTPALQGELAAATASALESRRLGHQEDALLCLFHAQRYLPDDPTLLHHIGIQLYDMHQLAGAAQVLSQAIAVAPEDPDNLYALARVELDQQFFPAAEKHFRAYLSARPDDASAHYGLGHLLLMQQRSDDAIEQFNKSVELQPLQTESYYQLGQIALDGHHNEVARSFFLRTLSRAPAHGGALTGIGILDYRAKEYVLAAGFLRKATTASPDYQVAHYYLGLTLARLNEQEESMKELRVATDLARATAREGRSSCFTVSSLKRIQRAEVKQLVLVRFHDRPTVFPNDRCDLK